MAPVDKLDCLASSCPDCCSNSASWEVWEVIDVPAREASEEWATELGVVVPEVALPECG